MAIAMVMIACQARAQAMLQRGIKPGYLLALMCHEYIARRFTILKHMSGGCIEQRKEDVVWAKN
jgi:hypothetical protein